VGVWRLGDFAVQPVLMSGVNNELTHRHRALEVSAVFMLALAVRLTYIAWRGPVASPDTAEYVTLAQNLAGHGIFSVATSAPFEPSIRRAPVYPSFLALLGWFGVTSPAAVVSIQSILDAGVAVVILLLGRGIVAGKWARVAAGMYAVHPGAVLSSASLLSETVFTDLLVGSAWLLITGLQKDRLGLAGMAGFGLGLAILCRPTALLLPPAIVLVFRFARGVRRPAVVAAIFLAAVVSVLCPWVIRSSILAGRFVPVQAYGAVNLYVATRVDWDWRNEAFWWPRVWEDLGMRAARTPEEMADLDRWFMRQAVKNIMSDPSGYIVSRAKALPFLFLTSFDKFTGLNESFGSVTARGDFRRFLVKISLLALFSLIPISLAILGLTNSLSHPVAWVSAVFWMYVVVVHAPTFFENRYLWPAVPFQVESAAIGIAQLGDLVWRRT
jgi:Dolichyl-phosphate-mannose-protein mannosyltransferase